MHYLYSSLEYLTPQSTTPSFLCSKFKHFCLIFLLLLSWKGFSQTDPNAVNTGPTHDKYVVGYYPQWAIYARDFNVSDIEADKLTHLMYAFYDVEFDENNYPLLSSLDDYADFEHTEDPGVSFSNSL